MTSKSLKLITAYLAIAVFFLVGGIIMQGLDTVPKFQVKNSETIMIDKQFYQCREMRVVEK